MTSRRTAKVAEAIREQVSTTILFGIKDPRVKNVTVTRVEVAGDLRRAKVYVSVMGDEKQQSLCMHGLNSARGFLQSKIADRIKTRFTPELVFVLDQGVKHSLEATRILRELGLGNDEPESGDSNIEEPENEEHPSDEYQSDEADSLRTRQY